MPIVIDPDICEMFCFQTCLSRASSLVIIIGPMKSKGRDHNRSLFVALRLVLRRPAVGCDNRGVAVRKTHRLRHFYTKMHRFTKTGSGQT